jgi:putative addiction module CopG family antidote
MSVVLTPEVERHIHELVASGNYPDADALIRHALALLEEHRAHDEALMRMLQVGLDEADAGEVDEWTPELSARLLREAEEMYLRDEEPDPEFLSQDWLQRELDKSFEQADRGELIDFNPGRLEHLKRAAIDGAQRNASIRDAIRS